ncbi:MAG: radical SAM protein [Clostridia bacterium]|nr:radical SAM protein [Clostridia bacterium]
MKRFRKVYIEITNICNMNCSFCPETKRAKATMSKEQFEYIAKQIKPYTDYVYLHVKGEPLLHPNLEEILEICKEYNLKVNISTNGTLLGKKQELLKDIRQLNVSLHSFENNQDEKLECYLQEVLAATDNLNKSGVIIRYKLWNDNTINNNDKIIQKLEEKYNIDIKNSSYDKDIKLKENIFLSIKEPFEWPKIEGENKQETTCYGLRQQIAILVDGTVVPCCVDNNGDINLGNIFKTELEDILNTEKAQKIKRDFENNKCSNSLCKKCEYRIRVTQM